MVVIWTRDQSLEGREEGERNGGGELEIVLFLAGGGAIVFVRFALSVKHRKPQKMLHGTHLQYPPL